MRWFFHPDAYRLKPGIAIILPGQEHIKSLHVLSEVLTFRPAASRFFDEVKMVSLGIPVAGFDMEGWLFAG